MKFAHILSQLGLNAVPAAGWFLDDWSAGTTLVVYWFENVAAALLIGARMRIHRRWVPVRGHFRYATRQSPGFSGPRTYLQHFLPTTLIFSAAHGIFLGVLLFLMTQSGRGAEVRVDPAQVAMGCGGAFLFLAGDFVLDLFTLKKRSFRWIEVLTERNFGRVLLVHMTLIIGLLAGGLAGGARGFFAVFVVLKTLNDLSVVLPQYEPKEAPRWLCALMDRVPNLGKTRNAENFAKFWRRDLAAERNRQAENERPYQP